MRMKMRALSLLLVIAVCFVMLFSAVYIAAESDHDCTGEHCPICYQIGICVSTLTNPALAVVAAAIAAAAVYAAVRLPWHAAGRCTSASLVSLKVKLSN